MKFYFNVTDEFISSELMKGKEVKREQCIDIDFSALAEDQRETILKHSRLFSRENCLVAGCFQKKGISTPRNYFAEIFYPDNRDAVKLSGTSIEAIIASFKKFEKERSALIAEEKSEIEKAIDQFIKGGTMRIFGNGIYNDFSGYFHLEELQKNYESKVKNYGELSVSFDQIRDKANEYLSLKVEHNQKRKEKFDAEKKQAENKKKEVEAKKENLRQWAIQNGSDLVKLRIKHCQNWESLATIEWAKAHSTGFDEWEYDESDDDWGVNNATIEQLQALETAKSENPDHEVDIIRSKWVDNYEDVIHHTFLRCVVKTPVGTIPLYKEIDDVSDEDDE